MRSRYARRRNPATSWPSAARSRAGRSALSSPSRRTRDPTLGPAGVGWRPASHASRRARVAGRGIAPARKFLKPLGLKPTSRAARRNDSVATSRATASRRTATGSEGGRRARRIVTGLRPPRPAVQFVQLRDSYTCNARWRRHGPQASHYFPAPANRATHAWCAQGECASIGAMLRRWHVPAVLLSLAGCWPRYDVVIRGGTIHDGSGNDPLVGDLALDGRGTWRT